MASEGRESVMVTVMYGLLGFNGVLYVPVELSRRKEFTVDASI